METLKIEVANGYVNQKDLGFEDHRRGTNYIATVQFDPSQPGGLGRQFWNKGSGSYREIPANIEIGEFVEVAHDYTSSGGNRNKHRDYYRVASITNDELELVEDKAPLKSSMSIPEFKAMVSGIVIEKPSIDLSKITDEVLISELKKRGYKINN